MGGADADPHRVRPDQVELVRRDYAANGGWETFLAYEDPAQDILVGLLRLRRCSPDAFREELRGGRASIVRELHVYGTAVPVASRDPARFQHQGYGTLLMEEAARIARDEHGSERIAVSESGARVGAGLRASSGQRRAWRTLRPFPLCAVSGVGTRHYYRKLGYELLGPYMVMELR